MPRASQSEETAIPARRREAEKHGKQFHGDRDEKQVQQRGNGIIAIPEKLLEMDTDKTGAKQNSRRIL